MMRLLMVSFTILVLLCPPTIGYTDELGELLSGFDTEEQPPKKVDQLDELLGGFTDTDSSTGNLTEEENQTLPTWLELTGRLSLLSTINITHDAPAEGTPDYRGLSMLKTLGELQAEAELGAVRAKLGITAFYDAAYHLGDQKNLYTAEYLDEYENEIELGEAYFQANLNRHIDYSGGRQIVVWGKSDNIRITDVLNPLDRRWPGMLDIRYLRLPVTMSKLDYFFGDWSLNSILIHEPRFDKFPVYNGEFFPGTRPVPDQHSPSWSWDNQELGFALNGIFSGWDLSFYAAYVYPENSFVKIDSLGTPYRSYEKALMLGSAGNIAFGNWLFKAEAAYWQGLNYSAIDTEKSRFDALLGVDYMGFSDTAISVELANRHILDYDPLLRSLPDGQKEDWNQLAFRLVKDFFNDTVHLTLLISSYGLIGADGGFERLQLEYDWTDNISVTGGLVLYQSGDHPGFGDIGSNDRLLLELRYSF